MSSMEKRRFPRVRMRPTMAEAIAWLGGQVVWPNLETSEIVDLSYRGLAAQRPGLLSVSVQQNLEIEIRLGDRPGFKTAARVAWCNTEWVGVEFGAVSAEGHLVLSDFLDALVAGANLRQVDKGFVTGGQNFEFWFQGAGGVSLFIWLNADRQITRVQLDFGDSSTSISRGESGVFADGSSGRRRALLLLSQMDKPGVPMEDFLRSLGS
ncbi:MAG: PilZ domain-containing protein [Calothrix sp. SM1_5_4]|nr:PilZ domain-containing protein [Calothrix sp. SM1_5_4]